MNYLRSLTFNLAFWGWTAIMVLGCSPTLLGPRSWAAAAQRGWARGVLFLARIVAGIRYQVRGHHLVPDGPVIYACKHQSVFETAVFCVLVTDPAIVLKRELLSIPLYGWYSRRMGMIPVDRRGAAGAMRKMLRAADRAIGQQRSIVIFPEGSRAPVGTPGTYHPGVAGLYRHLHVPVVPVALNSGVLWPRRTVLKHPGTITVQYLEPIAPGLDRGAFMAELQRRIETASNALLPDSAESP